MQKKLFKQLAFQSYKGNELDEKTVIAIANQLPRKELKKYIKELKREENRKSIEITLAKEPTDQDKKEFRDLFPDKKILYKVNPSLIIGMEVKNNDMIYELNLKHTLNKIVNYLGES